jgi:hypothetical protein
MSWIFTEKDNEILVQEIQRVDRVEEILELLFSKKELPI